MSRVLDFCEVNFGWLLLGLIVASLAGLVLLIVSIDRDMTNAPCSELAGMPLRDLPARCVRDFAPTVAPQ